MKNLNLRKGFAGISDTNIRHISAYFEDRAWNGWACPWFTLANALRVLELIEANGLQGFEYKLEEGKLSVRDKEGGAEDFEEVRTIEHEGVTLYALGNCSWAWDEEEQEKSFLAEFGIYLNSHISKTEEREILAHNEDEAEEKAQEIAKAMEEEILADWNKYNPEENIKDVWVHLEELYQEHE